MRHYLPVHVLCSHFPNVALGHKQTFLRCPDNVRLPPKADIKFLEPKAWISIICCRNL